MSMVGSWLVLHRNGIPEAMRANDVVAVGPAIYQVSDRSREGKADKTITVLYLRSGQRLTCDEGSAQVVELLTGACISDTCSSTVGMPGDLMPGGVMPGMWFRRKGVDECHVVWTVAYRDGDPKESALVSFTAASHEAVTIGELIQSWERAGR